VVLNTDNMKKIYLLSLLFATCFMVPSNGQIGKFIKNVKNNVKQDLLGTPGSKTGGTKTMPEPSCTCDAPEVVVDLGKYRIEYSETTISMLDDGSILLGDRMSDNFYIALNGNVNGPYKKDDPRVAKFQSMEQSSDNHADLTVRYSNYITKSGDKFTITFGGKKYGPYALISKFAVSLSGDKFAAAVTQTLAMTESEGKQLEEKAKNAKTDQEKMQIAMEYSQQMQQKMMDGGGPQSMQPKIISNVPVVSGDNNTLMMLTGNLYSNLKYDEILVSGVGKFLDLNGNTVISTSGSYCPPESMFIKSDNSGYACFMNGTLTFSDGKKMAELFSPHLVKQDGKIYLAYFYYSPKRNSIVQCKIPF